MPRGLSGVRIGLPNLGKGEGEGEGGRGNGKIETAKEKVIEKEIADREAVEKETAGKIEPAKGGNSIAITERAYPETINPVIPPRPKAIRNREVKVEVIIRA